MKKIIAVCLLLSLILPGCKESREAGDGSVTHAPDAEPDGWQVLFNGRDLTGWEVSETPGSFTVKDGVLVVHGGRSHLFYTGPVENADFKDFEFTAKVKTTPGSNSGIYFHTEYQQTGWPKKGYESQVNITHSDSQKSGGLYDAAKVYPAPAEDNQWYTHDIIVRGKHVIVKINDKTVVDYTEADNVNFPGWPGRRISSGTFAIQAHDPKSLVYIKDIKVRPLKTKPNQPPEGFVSLFNGADLTGWKRHENLPGHGVGGKWTVEEGAIAGMQDPPGKGGFLTTLKEFKNFELLLETKIDWPFDSGVFLRVGPEGKSHQVTIDYRPGGEIGGIYCPWTQAFVHHCPEGINHFRRDDWNAVRIICAGEPARIHLWLNDTLITDFQHTDETTAGIPQQGTICLQVHPGGKGHEKSKARFRNIFVRQITE